VLGLGDQRPDALDRGLDEHFTFDLVGDLHGCLLGSPE
jgi:hypothetical protein